CWAGNFDCPLGLCTNPDDRGAFGVDVEFDALLDVERSRAEVDSAWAGGMPATGGDRFADATAGESRVAADRPDRALVCEGNAHCRVVARSGIDAEGARV